MTEQAYDLVHGAGKEILLTNAAIVTPTDVFTGTVHLRNGHIQSIDSGNSLLPHAKDLEGDYLFPGLIEMHTDNLEKHLVPRPGVEWPSAISALMAHDVQVTGAGITTVLDSIFVGEYEEKGTRKKLLDKSIQAIHTAQDLGLLRANHFLHLRCEFADEHVIDMFEPHVDDPLLHLVSLMDHTPGQRQWSDLQKWRKFHEKDNWTDKQADSILHSRLEIQKRYAETHRNRILELCRERHLPLASHDDTTKDHVMEGQAFGINISEFPTTAEAAAKAHELGMYVVMGAPNVVRGGSHSGNVSAMDLAAEGHLDGLSSDYAPKSLLHAAFLLTQVLGTPLNEAIAKVSANVADMLKLDDRGKIEPGKRADLVRVVEVDRVPIVRSVWNGGKRML